MAEDFIEIDFLDIGDGSSGDAIPGRYRISDEITIHVTDGGYQNNSDDLIHHINTHYGNPEFIHHVVATHPDGDHLGGLRELLANFRVGFLWMLIPWNYVDILLPHFATYNSKEALTSKLKELYPNVAALEEIANEQEIPIYEPFQGAQIGAFSVLAPTIDRYLNCILDSGKTPERVQQTEGKLASMLLEALKLGERAMSKLATAIWGDENLSNEQTSRENEMSVVQYANICGLKILLTADAGREALEEAISYAPFVGLTLPGIDRFQVPHHGSRRNVSSDILNSLIGPKLDQPLSDDQKTVRAYVSAAKNDSHHPKMATLRALHHRGARIIQTKGSGFYMGSNVPSRDGWGPVTPVDYPTTQEE